MNSHNELVMGVHELVTEGIRLSVCLNMSPKLNYESE
jgi:hypothetical protein